jgi:hypothetical protein
MMKNHKSYIILKRCGTLIFALIICNKSMTSQKCNQIQKNKYTIQYALMEQNMYCGPYLFPDLFPILFSEIHYIQLE